MENEELREPDLLELSDDDGNTLLMTVRNYFFYNGEEYAALQEAVNSIRSKYGKDAMFRGMDLEEAATTRERNHQVGGHKE